MINRKLFFDGYRESLDSLNKEQVEGLEFLLGSLESDPRWLNVQQMAYVLATIDHETAHTFQPIKEYRARAGTPGRANQDRYWLSGYYGRGYVQLTWEKNYEKFGIAEDPDKALEPATAYRILADGMMHGSFTGHKLSEFVNNKETDYVNARRVINGLDKAKEIAKVAGRFEAILAAAQETTAPVVSVVEPVPAKPPEDKPQVQTVPGRPPTIEVKQQSASWTTKIAAATASITPVLTATGLKIGGVTFSTGTLYAIAAVVIVGIIVGGYIYNEGQKRAQERLRLSMNNLADPNRGNVVAGNV